MASTPRAHRFLDRADAEAVSARVASLEAMRGVEVVTAVIARADSYPEVPWKAFAVGASFAALAAAAMTLLETRWDAFEAVVQAAVAVLAVGGAFALATVWIPPLARIFIPTERREAEVRQYAQALFLESGLHRTRRHDGILILVSLLEREAVIIADRGVSDKIARVELDSIVVTVTGAMARGALADALLAGLEQLDKTLAHHGLWPAAGDTNELTDSVIQEKGPS